MQSGVIFWFVRITSLFRRSVFTFDFLQDLGSRRLSKLAQDLQMGNLQVKELAEGGWLSWVILSIQQDPATTGTQFKLCNESDGVCCP